jgi:hypothetical protein
MKSKFKRGIRLIVLLSCLAFPGWTLAQDSAQTKMLQAIVAKINEIDLLTTANNDILSQQIIYEPGTRALFVLNQANNSIDIIEGYATNNKQETLRVDVSQYGGSPYRMAFGAGVLGVLLRTDSVTDKLVCLGKDGRFLRTFDVDTALQGIYFNAFAEQFILYSNGTNGYQLNILQMKGGAAYLASAELIRYSFLKENTALTPSAKMEKMDPYGIVMTIFAMAVVFLALIALYVIFRYIAKIYTMDLRKRFLKKKGGEVQPDQLPGIHDTTNELGAAIGLALYFYSNELHDHENTVLTIKKAVKIYSPWSSKIYGIRKPLK